MASDRWQRAVLADTARAMLDRPWTRDLYLRGSLARGTEDGESDIDLVVTVDDAQFDAALAELTVDLPRALPGGLPPWLDTIVSDFGGLGFVYLLRVDELKWGQLDIYLLPYARRRILLDNAEEGAVLFHAQGGVEQRADELIDATRRAFRASQGVPNAVLACYVLMILLRKRIARGDALQTYADGYATAELVRDLVFVASGLQRNKKGWRDLDDAAALTGVPDQVRRAVRAFAQPVEELASRVGALETLVDVLAPALWRAHGASLRELGSYLARVRATRNP